MPQDLSIDWSQVAFGRGKNRRKTVTFGKFNKSHDMYDDEFYIRELSIVDAGLGSGLWDAAIIFSRFIYENSHIFENKTIIELGCGVGLCSIVAARFGSSVIATDYMQSILDNLNYNIQLNDYTDKDLPPLIKGRPDVASIMMTRLLDWTCPEEVCHSLPKPDIIIGSELTYSTLNIHDLAKTLDLLAKPTTVFYEILSTDREGVGEFLDVIKSRGWTVSINPVPERYMGNFKTKQRSEDYMFYTFRPSSECIYPDLK
ncbi:hypothetical protein RCL1_001120 [Eukaryota sp. TZLM3-RCL]